MCLFSDFVCLSLLHVREESVIFAEYIFIVDASFRIKV